MKHESLLKAIILSNGVDFSDRALLLARSRNAKKQNLCYNLPNVENALHRPQELLLTNREDGYSTVVSCVAPHKYREPLKVDVLDGEFIISGQKKDFYNFIKIDVVNQPNYYDHVLSSGALAKEYVSACGYDELNILPWAGCAISRPCAFCGINQVTAINRFQEKLTAQALSRDNTRWNTYKKTYLPLLKEAVLIAKKDAIYAKHLHPIMISGNLADDSLDFEAEIYAEIADFIFPLIEDRIQDGVIAVIEPPPSDSHLKLMRQSHIATVVFNLEIAHDPWLSEYCPGKNILRKNYVKERLYAALPIFGRHKVWTNFVLGLEPVDALLDCCRKLAQDGIIPSANVFHCDAGSRLKDFEPPSHDVVIDFFNETALIYKQNGMNPFYCAKALRTSLANEAYDGRLANE